MIYAFKGPYPFDSTTLTSWNSNVIGVYYCGVKTPEGKLTIYYIGKSVADGGVRGRLLQHLSERKWPDVTHFGYEQCDTVAETEKHELAEIPKYKPKYNIQGK
ncbi:MAG: hypothetical protein KBC69_00605 [Candidatus Magasanikbacteria bacterium]|nr:hypothetical protein [Candidatus Magasanikbacteria bacterium]